MLSKDSLLAFPVLKMAIAALSMWWSSLWLGWSTRQHGNTSLQHTLEVGASCDMATANNKVDMAGESHDGRGDAQYSAYA